MGKIVGHFSITCKCVHIFQYVFIWNWPWNDTNTLAIQKKKKQSQQRFYVQWIIASTLQRNRYRLQSIMTDLRDDMDKAQESKESRRRDGRQMKWNNLLLFLCTVNVICVTKERKKIRFIPHGYIN